MSYTATEFSRIQDEAQKYWEAIDSIINEMSDEDCTDEDGEELTQQELEKKADEIYTKMIEESY